MSGSILQFKTTTWYYNRWIASTWSSFQCKFHYHAYVLYNQRATTCLCECSTVCMHIRTHTVCMHMRPDPTSLQGRGLRITCSTIAEMTWETRHKARVGWIVYRSYTRKLFTNSIFMYVCMYVLHSCSDFTASLTRETVWVTYHIHACRQERLGETRHKVRVGWSTGLQNHKFQL